MTSVPVTRGPMVAGAGAGSLVSVITRGEGPAAETEEYHNSFCSIVRVELTTHVQSVT